MKLVSWLSLAALSALPSNLWAADLPAAQQCGERLLSAYNARRYPAEIIDHQKIIQRAFGVDYRGMNIFDKKQADQVAFTLLHKIFTASQYKYRDLRVVRTETLRKNTYRATGSVYVSSAEHTGVVEFVAHSTGICNIYYVQVAKLKTIEALLRVQLINHPKTSKLFR